MEEYTTFDILKLSLAARLRGHKQRKLMIMFIHFFLFVSSKPHYRAEFSYIESGLLPEDLFWSHFFLIRENFFQIFRTLSLKISYCLSVNHNPESRCVICIGDKCPTLMLHLNCAAPRKSESSNFFMYIIRKIMPWINLFVRGRFWDSGIEN